MQGIILAAGMGKRLKELTNENTKCMVKVNGVTMIERALRILDKKRPNHDFTDPNLQNSYVAYTLDYIHKNYMHKILQEDIAKELQISVDGVP